MPEFGKNMVNSVMRSEELNSFLESDEEFDVCIMELFGDEALLVSVFVMLTRNDIISSKTLPPRAFLKNSAARSSSTRLMTQHFGLIASPASESVLPYMLIALIALTK
jgi:hypothetical protein